MWALVESGSITATYNQPKAIQIGDIKYPKNIFEAWSKSELEAVGLYEVVYDRTNFKDKEYYINTDETLTFASNTVTASWGTATAKALNDSSEEINGVTHNYKGLKTLHKETVDQQAYSLLQSSDWMVVRNAESSKAIPSDWLDFRVNVRSTASDMKDKIDAVSDVDGLAALYVYNSKTGTRPLGEFPTPPSS